MSFANIPSADPTRRVPATNTFCNAGISEKKPAPFNFIYVSPDETTINVRFSPLHQNDKLPYVFSLKLYDAPLLP